MTTLITLAATAGLIRIPVGYLMVSLAHERRTET